MTNKKKLNLEELKELVFNENKADKRNKDKLFKLAKANDDLETIEKLRDDFGFKGAKVYLQKLQSLSLLDSIKNRDIKLFKEFISNDADISKIKIDDLIDKKYDDEFIQIFIEKGYYINIAQLTKKNYKPNIIKFALDNGAKVDDIFEHFTALAHSSRMNKINIVEILLEYNPSINKKFQQGLTSLLIALVGNHYNIVKLLLANGANPDIKISNGFTALIQASNDNNFEMVKLLVDKGADINATTANNGTALMFSIMDNNNFKMAKFLLENGANPNIKEAIQGFTALDWADRNENNKLISLLLKFDAKYNHKEIEPPKLIKAILDYDFEKAEEFLKLGHNIDEEFNTATALMQYSALGDVEIVNLLLDYGADINYQTKIGFTPLLGATHHKQEEVVKLFIQRGVNTSLKGYLGFTALDIAKNQNHINLIEILTDKNSSNKDFFLKEKIQKRVENDYQELIINKISKVGIEKTKEYFENTPSLQELEQEIGKIKKDSIPFIVRSLKRTMLLNEDMQQNIIIEGLGTYDGSYIDKILHGITFSSIKTNVGYFLDFPYHSAVLDPFSETKLPNGINWDNSIGNTIDINQPFIFVLYGNHIFLHRVSNTNFKRRGLYQIKNGLFQLEKELLDFNYNNKFYDDFFRLVQSEDIYETVFELKNLIEQQNIDINKKNFNHETALIIGIKQGNTQVVKFLLDNSADVNIQDKEGFTPLMIATSLNNYQICQDLLKYGASINMKNYRGQDSTILASTEMNPDIIILFEDYGVEVNAIEPYIVNNNEEVKAKEILFKLEEQLESKELITEFLIYGLDFNYVYELDLDYYIENNSDFLVSFRLGRDVNFNSMVVNIYKVLHEDYLENINASDENKSNIRIKIFDLLMEKYQLGKYENSKFKEILSTDKSGFIHTLKLIKNDINGEIDVFDNRIILKLLDKNNSNINSFIYEKKDENKYRHSERGELIITKTSIIEKDKNGGQRFFKYIKKENDILNLKSTNHNPRTLSRLLQKFSLNEKLRYSNHPWETSLDYDDFMKNLKEGFDNVSEDLKLLAPTLHEDIKQFLFSKDETIIGWSSLLIEKAIRNNELPSSIQLDNSEFKTFTDAIDDFKSLFVVKQNDKKLKLLKRFTKIKKELNEENKLEIKLNLDDLKEDKIDKFFIDTKRLEKALKLILIDINENLTEDTKNVIIEANIEKNMIEIKIIHVGSTTSKSADGLKETIDKNGGNFKTIYDNLISVCDWSIDTICSDGNRYKIDYLYPKLKGNEPICTQIDDNPRGFTHILRFYI